MVRVSAIVPNWNGAVLLRSVLVCLRNQTQPIDEVIVVDNGSTDESVSVAEGLGARVIRLNRNEGFAKAVNEGVRAAAGEWLVILNNDVEIGEDWLDKLLSESQGCNAWFASGKLLQFDRPGVLDGAWDALCRGACAWRCGHARNDGPPWDTQRSIRFASFTALLARTELFRLVGSLDETFESYLEDVDFGIRCAIRGYSGVYVPNAVARHRGSATLGRWHRGTVRRISRNQLLLVAKHFPKGWIVRFGWPVLVSQVLWGLLALRHRTGLAYLAGKIDALRIFRGVRGRSQHDSAISAILHESEAEIRELQQQTGYDLYWRVYFALT
ncbi:MAG TPA: glycosyltransferase family 2 protein [Bryobacteraceae bacterium]|nr:glycosyltransferase family 2 protein [Bryobacteraceae bacterium]